MRNVHCTPSLLAYAPEGLSIESPSFAVFQSPADDGSRLEVLGPNCRYGKTGFCSTPQLPLLGLTELSV